jgi:transposase InsO family protein
VEEHQARQARPPGRGQPYSPEQKQKILEAFATRQVPVDVFCKEHGVPYATLHGWKKPKVKGATKKPKAPRSFTPEQRKQAVEAFGKSGQSLKAFAKAWGVNEQVLGRWAKTYRTLGPKALAGKRTGRKPGRMAVAPALREGIKRVKAEFPDFGLRKVQGFLARFRGLKASHPVIRRVVSEEGLPPGKAAPERWKKKHAPRRFERSRPGELWQTDITSFLLPRHSQRVYLVAFMDDYSRYIVSWKLGMKQTAEFVQEALLEGIQRFGKPKELLSDQGRQYHTWRGKSSFEVLLDRQGIRHILSRPQHPQTVGKCERFWKTVGEEFWARVKPLELHDAQARLSNFINHYNHFRPHQGLDNAVPADRFFGAESQVRLALEAAWERNQHSLAIDEPTRNPVFFVGQFGDQAVSLHGERGKLVLQNSEGVRQELATSDLGMAQAFPLPLEKIHGTELDGTSPQREHGGTPGEDESLQTTGQAQVELQDGYAAVSGAGHLGDGPGNGASGSPQVGRADAGTLAGTDDPQEPRGETQSAATQGVADEPTSTGWHGGGSDGPAQAAAEGDAHGDGEEDGEGRIEDPAQTSLRTAAGQQGLERAAGSAEGHAKPDGGAVGAEGEKNQPFPQDSQPAHAGSEHGSGVQTESGVTEPEPPALSA